jgi:cation diffusion facilitator CzcD-associated flavoprotein CzcO
VRKVLLRRLARQLPPGYDVATHFTPSYDPWDQRICVVPDGDLFRAIGNGRAEVVTDHVDRFVTEGVRLRSGRVLPADIVVTATGLELLFLGGIDLRVDGRPVEAADRLTYKGMMLEGVPNAAMAVGYTNASWTLKSELTCDYVARLLNHMRTIGATRVLAVNNDPTMERAPLLGLSSGYVVRAEDKFPKQGRRYPWQMHQSYLADHRVMKRRPLADDGALVFSAGSPTERRVRPATVIEQEQSA